MEDVKVMEDRIREAVDFLSSKITSSPVIGIILGTGLGGITEKIEMELRVPYEEIPHFPVSTIEGHRGTLVFGALAGKKVVAMEGRFHLYEGYTPEEVTFPVRVMSKLGVRYLFISSAAGGLDPEFTPGDLMVVMDHINFTWTNPLIGPNLDALGPRFPDMSEVYDRDLINTAKKEAANIEISLKEGVYAGVLGPSLETPAETRFLRMAGADAVGMSTVSEVIVGVHCELKILLIVVITNVNIPDAMEKTSLEEVIAAAGKASPGLSLLWERVIGALP